MSDPAEPGISLFFPVYGDESTVRVVAEKALALLPELAKQWEIIIVDDGSPDRSGEIAEILAVEHPEIRVLHHPRHLGYGAALRTGIASCRHEFVCMIDGDDEYDVGDLRKLWELRGHYDLIITFRYKKIYSSNRIFLSWVYNRLLRVLFHTHFRDISTGLRMAHRSMLRDLDLEADSTFIGAEMAIKAMLKGYRVGEVGIHSFPRRFGRSASTTARSIFGTMRDMIHTWKQVLSGAYGP